MSEFLTNWAAFYFYTGMGHVAPKDLKITKEMEQTYKVEYLDKVAAFTGEANPSDKTCTTFQRALTNTKLNSSVYLLDDIYKHFKSTGNLASDVAHAVQEFQMTAYVVFALTSPRGRNITTYTDSNGNLFGKYPEPIYFVAKKKPYFNSKDIIDELNNRNPSDLTDTDVETIRRLASYNKDFGLNPKVLKWENPKDGFNIVDMYPTNPAYPPQCVRQLFKALPPNNDAPSKHHAALAFCESKQGQQEFTVELQYLRAAMRAAQNVSPKPAQQNAPAVSNDEFVIRAGDENTSEFQHLGAFLEWILESDEVNPEWTMSDVIDYYYDRKNTEDIYTPNSFNETKGNLTAWAEQLTHIMSAYKAENMSLISVYHFIEDKLAGKKPELSSISKNEVATASTWLSDNMFDADMTLKEIASGIEKHIPTAESLMSEATKAIENGFDGSLTLNDLKTGRTQSKKYNTVEDLIVSGIISDDLAKKLTEQKQEPVAKVDDSWRYAVSPELLAQIDKAVATNTVYTPKADTSYPEVDDFPAYKVGNNLFRRFIHDTIMWDNNLDNHTALQKKMERNEIIYALLRLIAAGPKTWERERANLDDVRAKLPASVVDYIDNALQTLQ